MDFFGPFWEHKNKLIKKAKYNCGEILENNLHSTKNTIIYKNKLQNVQKKSMKIMRAI